MRAPSVFLVVSLAIATGGGWARAESLDEVLASLAAPRAVERVRAERALAPFLDTLDGVASITGRFPELPLEARLRVRVAITRHPASAAALVTVARRTGGDGAEAARQLLGSLLAAEIARRTAHEELADDPILEAPFAGGVITGLGWPLGRQLPLWYALYWLQQTVEPNKPIVLAPGLEAPDVWPAEMQPTTASALLRRWLDARDLALADLGIVRLVLPRASAEAFEALLGDEPERSSDPDGRDVYAAALLLELLLDTEVDDAAGEIALFRALEFAGAADAAAGWPGKPPAESLGAVALLPLSSRRVAPAWCVEMLGGQVPGRFRTHLLEELAHSPPLAAAVLPELLSAADPARRSAGCRLAARVSAERFVPELLALAQDAVAEVRMAAALALAWLIPADPGVGHVLAGTLAASGSEQDLRAALAAACNAGAACPCGFPWELLTVSSNRVARSVGVAVMAAAGVDPWRGAPFLPLAEPLALASWAVSTARFQRSAVGRPPFLAFDPPAAPATARLFRGLGTHDTLHAALAVFLAARFQTVLTGPAWSENARLAAATGDDVLLLTQLAISVGDLTRDDDFRASGLRLALKRQQATSRHVRMTSDELWTALTAEGRGQEVRLLDERTAPFAP